MKRALLVVIGMIFIAGCKWPFFSSAKQESQHEPVITKRCELSYFKSMVVSGGAKVELVRGNSAITIPGIDGSKHNCHNYVKDQVLHLPASGPVKVSAVDLDNIVVSGHATLEAKDFKANELTILAKDNGAINISGMVGIKKITQQGNGRINIEWLDSDELKIDANDDGPIYLGGVAKEMTATLTGNSKLYARYLRAKKGSVFTTDRALAEVTVLNKLGAFAVNDSNIYYFKIPDDLTVVTRDTANVLHPDWVR